MLCSRSSKSRSVSRQRPRNSEPSQAPRRPVHQPDAEAIFQRRQTPAHHDRRDPLDSRGCGTASFFGNEHKAAQLYVAIHAPSIPRVRQFGTPFDTQSMYWKSRHRPTAPRKSLVLSAASQQMTEERAHVRTPRGSVDHRTDQRSSG